MSHLSPPQLGDIAGCGKGRSPYEDTGFLLAASTAQRSTEQYVGHSPLACASELAPKQECRQQAWRAVTCALAAERAEEMKVGGVLSRGR